MKGFIKIHRKILENPIFFSDKGLRVWMWCLLRATHKPREIYLGNEKIKLRAGQFIFGRDSAAEQLQLKPSTVRNWINTLKVDSYLDIKTTNKYSIITILKWSEYQILDSNVDNKWTTNGQQMDTNKNVKNVKNTTSRSNSFCGYDVDNRPVYKVGNKYRVMRGKDDFYDYGGDISKLKKDI